MSNLVPEQRPDKNGRMVTRWVRRSAGSNKSELILSSVKVDIKETPTGESAKEVYERLMSALSPEDENVYDMTSEEKVLRRVRMDNKNVLSREFGSLDNRLLSLFDKFGESFSYRNIRYAGNIYTLHELDTNDLTYRQLESFSSLHKLLADKVFLTPEPSGRPTIFDAAAELKDHVLLNPEDGPIIEEIINRGVLDRDDLFDVLSGVKEGKIPSSIHGGYL